MLTEQDRKKGLWNIWMASKYREGLLERFKHENKIEQGDYYIIEKPLVLCSDFHECKGCPFATLRGMFACNSWLNRVNPDTNVYITSAEKKVFWRKEHDRQAKKILDSISKAIKDYITWMEH